MNWIELNSVDELERIKQKSFTTPQVIFKHSTRCSISSMALNRFEKNESPATIDFYFLDLIAHRNISNKISEEFNVAHQSPQVLVIKNGKCVFDESHSSIYFDEIVEEALKAS
ncbi:hypothetical protein GALL_206410 [mine drainage metagenome]|uniref:Bacillithiol system protein YtxJ n=1 Tax=mine drainage metagenome TaxID=410659 RepID=A0A1J5SAY1_9ZZZZ